VAWALRKNIFARSLRRRLSEAVGSVAGSLAKFFLERSLTLRVLDKYFL